MKHSSRLYIAALTIILFVCAAVLIGCDKKPVDPLKIEEGIPAPTQTSGHSGKWKDILLRLQPGQSAFITPEYLKGHKPTSAIQSLLRDADKLNIQIATQEQQGGLRVWRVK